MKKYLKSHCVELFVGNDDGLRSILLFTRFLVSINYLLSNFLLLVPPYVQVGAKVTEQSQ